MLLRPRFLSLFYKSTAESSANLGLHYCNDLASAVLSFTVSSCQFLATFWGHCLIGVTTLHSSGQQMSMTLFAWFSCSSCCGSVEHTLMVVHIHTGPQNVFYF